MAKNSEKLNQGQNPAVLQPALKTVQARFSSRSSGFLGIGQVSQNAPHFAVF
jgi:hypothetical protein